MMSEHWRYRIWCPDCCGEDFDGCFDGADELSARYPTARDAFHGGLGRVNGGIWRFYVERDGAQAPDMYTKAGSYGAGSHWRDGESPDVLPSPAIAIAARSDSPGGDVGERVGRSTRHRSIAP